MNEPETSFKAGDSRESNPAFTILIVDDTPENVVALESLLEEDGRIILKEQNGKNAVKCAMNHQIDLMLLDVNMPGMDGYEVAEILKANERTRHTAIIFITAQMKEQQHILKGYSEGAIDYLIRPLDPHITKSKVKAFQQLTEEKKQNRPVSTVLDNYLFVKVGAKYVKVEYDDILWFQAEDDYALIQMKKDKFIVHITMKALEPKLPPSFIRVHRSYIVNVRHVKSFHTYDLQIEGNSIPVGKSYQKKVIEMLNTL